MDKMQYIGNLYRAYDSTEDEEEKERIRQEIEAAEQQNNNGNTTKRGLLDRVLSPVNNSSLTSALYNATDDDPDTTFMQGIGAGIAKQNPFADGRVNENVHYGSDVLNNIFRGGEKPSTFIGKVTNAVGGFALDITTDPMNFIGGLMKAPGKILKGTGEISDASKTLADGFKVSREITKADAEKVISQRFAKTNIGDLKNNPIFEPMAEEFMENWNNRIVRGNKLYEDLGEQGITFSIRNNPVISKLADMMGYAKEDQVIRTIVSEDQLRRLDKKLLNISPYYNDLLQNLRRTKIAQAFKAENRIFAASFENMHKAMSEFDINTVKDNDQLLKYSEDLFRKITDNSESKSGESFIKHIGDIDNFIKAKQAEVAIKEMQLKRINASKASGDKLEEIKRLQESIKEAKAQIDLAGNLYEASKEKIEKNIVKISNVKTVSNDLKIEGQERLGPNDIITSRKDKKIKPEDYLFQGEEKAKANELYESYNNLKETPYKNPHYGEESVYGKDQYLKEYDVEEVLADPVFEDENSKPLKYDGDTKYHIQGKKGEKVGKRIESEKIIDDATQKGNKINIRANDGLFYESFFGDELRQNNINTYSEAISYAMSLDDVNDRRELLNDIKNSINKLFEDNKNTIFDLQDMEYGNIHDVKEVLKSLKGEGVTKANIDFSGFSKKEIEELQKILYGKEKINDYELNRIKSIFDKRKKDISNLLEFRDKYTKDPTGYIEKYTDWIIKKNGLDKIKNFNREAYLKANRAKFEYIMEGRLEKLTNKELQYNAEISDVLSGKLTGLTQKQFYDLNEIVNDVDSLINGNVSGNIFKKPKTRKELKNINPKIIKDISEKRLKKVFDNAEVAKEIQTETRKVKNDNYYERRRQFFSDFFGQDNNYTTGKYVEELNREERTLKRGYNLYSDRIFNERNMSRADIDYLDGLLTSLPEDVTSQEFLSLSKTEQDLKIKQWQIQRREEALDFLSSKAIYSAEDKVAFDYSTQLAWQSEPGKELSETLKNIREKNNFKPEVRAGVEQPLTVPTSAQMIVRSNRRTYDIKLYGSDTALTISKTDRIIPTNVNISNIKEHLDDVIYVPYKGKTTIGEEIKELSKRISGDENFLLDNHEQWKRFADEYNGIQSEGQRYHGKKIPGRDYNFKEYSEYQKYKNDDVFEFSEDFLSTIDGVKYQDLAPSDMGFNTITPDEVGVSLYGEDGWNNIKNNKDSILSLLPNYRKSLEDEMDSLMDRLSKAQTKAQRESLETKIKWQRNKIERYSEANLDSFMSPDRFSSFSHDKQSIPRTYDYIEKLVGSNFLDEAITVMNGLNSDSAYSLKGDNIIEQIIYAMKNIDFSNGAFKNIDEAKSEKMIKKLSDILSFDFSNENDANIENFKNIFQSYKDVDVNSELMNQVAKTIKGKLEYSSGMSVNDTMRMFDSIMELSTDEMKHLINANKTSLMYKGARELGNLYNNSPEEFAKMYSELLMRGEEDTIKTWLTNQLVESPNNVPDIIRNAKYLNEKERKSLFSQMRESLDRIKSVSSDLQRNVYLAESESLRFGTPTISDMEKRLEELGGIKDKYNVAKPFTFNDEELKRRVSLDLFKEIGEKNSEIKDIEGRLKYLNSVIPDFDNMEIPIPESLKERYGDKKIRIRTDSEWIENERKRKRLAFEASNENKKLIEERERLIPELSAKKEEYLKMRDSYYSSLTESELNEAIKASRKRIKRLNEEIAKLNENSPKYERDLRIKQSIIDDENDLIKFIKKKKRKKEFGKELERFELAKTERDQLLSKYEAQIKEANKNIAEETVKTREEILAYYDKFSNIEDYSLLSSIRRTYGEALGKYFDEDEIDDAVKYVTSLDSDLKKYNKMVAETKEAMGKYYMHPEYKDFDLNRSIEKSLGSNKIILSDEAREYIKNNKEEVKELFKGTKNMTAEQRNAVMRIRTGIDNFFESEVSSDYFFGKAMSTQKMINSDSQINQFINSFTTNVPADGVISKGETIIAKKGAISGAIEDYKKIISSIGDMEDTTLFDSIKLKGTELESKIKALKLDGESLEKSLRIKELSKEQYDFLNELKSINEKISGLNIGEVRNVRGRVASYTDLKKFKELATFQSNDSAQSFGKVLEFYDKMMAKWKALNTVVNPGFTVNNTIGNAANSFLYCGEAALNPKKISIAKTIVENPDPKQFIKIGGENVSYKTINNMLKEQGILGNSFYGTEIKNNDAFFDLLPIKKGFELNEKVEQTQRAALFIEALRNGESPEKAKYIVNKFLFDYSDLTDIEKNYFKRAIPFYTFMRKNVPLQLEQILAQPSTYGQALKAKHAFEMLSGKDYIDEDERNEWRKDYIQMPFKVGGRAWGVDLSLPAQQLDRLTPNKILGQTSPVIKTPVELATGKYAYTGMDIDGLDQYVANQFTPSRIVNTTGEKNGPNRYLYPIGQVSGVPMGTISGKSVEQKEKEKKKKKH